MNAEMTLLLDTILKNHTACLGMTGSGKTSTAKLLVERAVAAGSRVCVLDPIKSDWWGVTSSVDGKRAGLPFSILGGPRQHVPLHSGAGKAIGELVGTGQLPLSILDMADFEAGGMQRFFVDFAEAFWKSVRGVVYLVVEEAHEFAPKERAGIGQENMAIHWAKRFATGSRTKGIRLIVCSQAVQQLHNRVLGGCNTLCAHRLFAPADQKPVLDWLKANATKEVAKEVAESMSSLEDGESWVCSGKPRMFQRTQFPRISTYDNTKTPDEADGEHTVTTAAVDRVKLAALIGDVVKDAQENDPKKLRAENTELRRKLTAAMATPVPMSVDTNEVATLQRRVTEMTADLRLAETESARYRSVLEMVREELGHRAADIEARCAEIHAPRESAQRENRPPRMPSNVQRETNGHIRHPRTGPRPDIAEALLNEPKPTSLKREPAPRGNRPPGAGAQRTGYLNVLDAIAEWNALGVDEPTRVQVAGLLGCHARTKTFVNRMGEAKTAGMIEYGDGTLTLTREGRHAAKQVAAPDSLEALHQRIYAGLTPAQARLLGLVLYHSGAGVSRETLAAQIGVHPRTKTFVNTLGALSGRGLVSYGRGDVVPSAFLFPESLL